MKLIEADWPAPAHVRALTTTRQGGVSVAPFDTLNLGDHVEDCPQAVAQNRQSLLRYLQLDTPAQWLQQVHGVDVVEAQPDGEVRVADACWSSEPGQPCIVMTADCLPVCFTDRQGSRVAVAHAGWRGLCNGVLEQTLQIFDDPSQVIVWLGPAIGLDAFEVGAEVRQQFCERQPEAGAAFRPVAGRSAKWLADIYMLARLRLHNAGVTAVHGGGFCTVHDQARFFSYRRETRTGRMATLIWIDAGSARCE
ncbi:MAG: peptidoglycan editing factor PgeF [Marinobacterium sp.]|nr:peptidoglycan editing factor PgeF [Marinobacterium sp.]